MIAISDTVEGINDIVTSITGEGIDQRSYNPIRDDAFGGNELIYAVSEMGISLTTSTLASKVLANSTRVTTDGLRATAKNGLIEETKIVGATTEEIESGAKLIHGEIRNIKVHPVKQGKHILDHNNYKVAISRGKKQVYSMKLQRMPKDLLMSLLEKERFFLEIRILKE